MFLPLPDFPESESTPLVRQLLDLIGHLQIRIQELEDGLLRIKGLKTRPIVAPSRLEVPPRPPRDPGQKRPRSAKRPKTSQLVITEDVLVRYKPSPNPFFLHLERLVTSSFSSPDAPDVPLPEGERKNGQTGDYWESFAPPLEHTQNNVPDH